METMESGVYFPNPDQLLMVNYLQKLLHVHPSIEINNIINLKSLNENLDGFKIYFSDPDGAAIKLENEHLTVGDSLICVYPVTTYLTVLGIPYKGKSDFEHELKEAIKERFGTILHKIVVGQDWRVLIDIPEFKELSVFQQENSRDMTISLPKWSQELKVAFWCRHCRRNGHFQQECVLRSHPEMSTESCDPEKNGIKTGELQTLKNVQTSSKTPLKDPIAGAEKKIQKSINSIAERIGREEVLNSGIISEGNLNSRQTERGESASNISTGIVNDIKAQKEIKKENEENSISNDCGKGVIPKEEPLDHTDENNSFDGVASNDDDDDDDIKIIEPLINKTSPVNSPQDSNTNGRDAAYTSEDTSRSPTDSKRSFSFPSFTETEPFTPTPGPSVIRTFSRAPPASRVEVTTVLSKRLQDTINDACDTCRVLDRKKLDAFLIHVKKKSNPVRVALNFTENSDGLKEQLNRILHNYYNTPQTGTKEDMQFIKWLNGLVNRFDGNIPRKRKRNDQSSDRSPRKK